MTDRFEMALALCDMARRQVSDLTKTYQQSLREKAISIDLKIGIKNTIENLRSALDYTARETCERAGGDCDKVNVYFPIARKGFKASDFESLVGKNMAGLPSQRPDLVEVLATFQEFASPENDWLPELATLCNENKHQQLTPQVRREKREMRIRSGGVTMVIGEGTTLAVGPTATVALGGAVILGGQTFGPGSPPKVVGPGMVEDIVWVFFEFAATSRPVLPYLEAAISGVENITTTLKAKVGNG